MTLATMLGEGTGVSTQALVDYWNAFLSEDPSYTYNELDVKYRVPYGEGIKELASRLDIPHRKDFFGQAYVEPVHTDFVGSGYNPHLKFFPAYTRINENLELDVMMRLIQPPIETVSYSCVKDTYTRQFKPTINYGSSQSMTTGVAADGEYISYIEFDLTQMQTMADMNVVSAELVIGKIESTDGELKFYECYSNWSENYLIWITQLNISKNPFHVGTYTTGEVVVDIKSLIVSMLEQGRTRFSMAIKSKDLVILKTRESGVAPKIVFKYTDPSWNGFLENLHLTNTAIIRSLSKKDIYSVYRLAEKLLLPSSARLRNGRDFESTATINHPSMTGEATPVVSDRFPAQAVIRGNGNSDLVSSYSPHEVFQGGSANVPYRKDLFSFAEILPEGDQSDFNSNVDSIRTYLLSFVESVRSIYMPNQAIIRKLDESTLDSVAEIMNAFMYGKVIVSVGEALYGSATIRQVNVPNDFTSSANFDTPYLYSKATLRYNSHAYGQAVVRTPYTDDTHTGMAEKIRTSLISQYQIRKSVDLISFAEVWQNSHLPSNAVIRRSDNSDIPSQGIFRRSAYTDLSGLVEVPYYSDEHHGIADVWKNIQLASTAIIRQFDVYNLRSEADVRGGFYHEKFPSLAEIALKDSYLYCYAEIHSDARIWRPNKEGQLEFDDRKLPRIWVRHVYIND